MLNNYQFIFLRGKAYNLPVVGLLLIISQFFLACQRSPPNSDGSRSTNETNPLFTYLQIDSSSVQNPWAKMYGDLDADGKPDIIIGGQKGPLVWYRNPHWEKFVISTSGYETVDGEAGDIDGDGDIDVVMGGLFWYENPGGLLEAPSQDWTSHQIAHHATHDVELADLNLDGRLDIITRDQSEFNTRKGNQIHLWIQGDTGAWEEKQLQCPHGEGLRVIDLDQDGDPDVVATGIWFENTAGEPWLRHEISDWHPNSNIAVADLNEDHKLDIVLTPSELAGQYYRISWFEQPSDRHSVWTEHPIIDSVECVIHGVQVSDLNYDGLVDIVYSEMHQGQNPDEVVILFNRDRGNRWDKMVLSTRGSHSIEVVDLNGDDHPDVFGANWSGDFQPIEVWLSNPDVSDR